MLENNLNNISKTFNKSHQGYSSEINADSSKIKNNNYSNFSFNPKKSNNQNKYVYYANQKTNLRSPNDFIFLCDELHLYREIPCIGNFTSYKNKSVKGIFLDKTICMMNEDQFYAKIINKYGEKDIIYIPELPANSPYYPYIKHLFDFYDACFNPQNLENKEKLKIELEKKIDDRINKIDLFNNLIFNKNKEENYSKQYYIDNIPTVMDVQNLLKRNQKAIDNIQEIKYNNMK
jgi:hypothetical protein